MMFFIIFLNKTPLHLAAIYSQVEIVKQLLKAMDIQVEARDEILIDYLIMFFCLNFIVFLLYFYRKNQKKLPMSMKLFNLLTTTLINKI